MNDFMIQTKQLTKQFGHNKAVDQIDLNISNGSIHGFVGPNGSGKTTTMKMLIGAISPTSGMGEIKGFPLGSKESRTLIGYTPEKSSFYKNMNAMEYLIYMGKLSGLTHEKAISRAYELLEMLQLLPFRNECPYYFSQGMKKKIMIGQSLIHHPEILILDEPTANLDPDTRMTIIDILRSLVETEKITVFISSHILTELELLVNEVTLINKGKIILTGKIEEIKKRFKQGVIEINSDDNIKFKILLEELPFVDEVQIVNQKLKIYTTEPELLKKQLGRILYENQLMIHYLNEENITLNQIYQNVFGKNNSEGGILK